MKDSATWHWFEEAITARAEPLPPQAVPNRNWTTAIRKPLLAQFQKSLYQYLKEIEQEKEVVILTTCQSTRLEKVVEELTDSFCMA